VLTTLIAAFYVQAVPLSATTDQPWRSSSSEIQRLIQARAGETGFAAHLWTFHLSTAATWQSAGRLRGPALSLVPSTRALRPLESSWQLNAGHL